MDLVCTGSLRGACLLNVLVFIGGNSNEIVHGATFLPTFNSTCIRHSNSSCTLERDRNKKPVHSVIPTARLPQTYHQQAQGVNKSIDAVLKHNWL